MAWLIGGLFWSVVGIAASCWIAHCIRRPDLKEPKPW